MPSIPAPERSEAAKANAHTSWANTTDRTARTAAARAGLWQKFLDQADGDRVRAEHLWKAYFARLRLKSMQAMRKAKEQAALAMDAETELEALGGEEAPR